MEVKGGVVAASLGVGSSDHSASGLERRHDASLGDRDALLLHRLVNTCPVLSHTPTYTHIHRHTPTYTDTHPHTKTHTHIHRHNTYNTHTVRHLHQITFVQVVVYICVNIDKCVRIIRPVKMR